MNKNKNKIGFIASAIRRVLLMSLSLVLPLLLISFPLGSAFGESAKTAQDSQQEKGKGTRTILHLTALYL